MSKNKTKDIEWTDLGLPSGRLWALVREPVHCTRKEAEEEYGQFLPSNKDFAELSSYCTVTCDAKSKTFVIHAPGGKTMEPKANGYRQRLLTHDTDRFFFWMKEGVYRDEKVNVGLFIPETGSPFTFASAGGGNRCSLLLTTLPEKEEDASGDEPPRGGKVLSLKYLMAEETSKGPSDSAIREAWNRLTENYVKWSSIHDMLTAREPEIERGEKTVVVRYAADSASLAEWFTENMLAQAESDLARILGTGDDIKVSIGYRVTGEKDAASEAGESEDAMTIIDPPEPVAEEPEQPAAEKVPVIPPYMLPSAEVDRFSLDQIRGQINKVIEDVMANGVRRHEGHCNLYDKCFEWLLAHGYIFHHEGSYELGRADADDGFLSAAWEMFPSGARKERKDAGIVLRIADPAIAAVQPRSEFAESLKHIYRAFKDGTDNALDAARSENTFLIDMEVFLWTYFMGIITGTAWSDGTHSYRWFNSEMKPTSCLLDKMTSELVPHEAAAAVKEAGTSEAPKVSVAKQEPVPAPEPEKDEGQQDDRESIRKYSDLLGRLRLVTCGKGCPATLLGKYNQIHLIDVLQDMKVLKNTGTAGEPILTWDDVFDPGDEDFIRAVLRIWHKKYFSPDGNGAPSGEEHAETPVQASHQGTASATERIPLSEFTDRELFEAFKAMGGFINDSKAYYKLYLI